MATLLFRDNNKSTQKFYRDKNTIRVKISKSYWDKLIGIFDDKTRTKIENKIKKWKKKDPTLRELEEFSKKIHIPLHVITSEEIPDLKPPEAPFYRKGIKMEERLSPPFYELYKTLKYLQGLIRELKENEGEGKNEWVGKFSADDDPEYIAEEIRNHIDMQSITGRSRKDFFNLLRERVENTFDFIVVTYSYLKTNTRERLDPKELKGFALPDEFAPIIFVNTNEGENKENSKSSQIYTLMHETAHILINSGEFLIEHVEYTKDKNIDTIEKFCDHLAGAILMPKDEFVDIFNTEEYWIEKASYRFRVSKFAVLKRAYVLNLISISEYKELFNKVDSEYHNYLETMKEPTQKRKGDFYNTQRFFLGNKLLSYINKLVMGNYEDIRDITYALGMRYDSFLEILHHEEVHT